MPEWQDAAEVRRATRGEMIARARRDTDVGRRSQVFRIFTWSLTGGVVGGLLGGFGMAQGVWGLREVALFALFGWAASFFFPLLVSGLGGRAARTLYTPSGRSTPRQAGYSQAESLAARGMFEEGIAAFEAAVASDPRDPTPYLRIARIYRDRLQRYDEAAHWFKRALSESRITPGAASVTRRELVELYVSKMHAPGRAAPLLARTAEEQAGTEEGAWAARELALIKARIAGEARSE